MYLNVNHSNWLCQDVYFGYKILLLVDGDSNRLMHKRYSPCLEGILFIHLSCRPSMISCLFIMLHCAENKSFIRFKWLKSGMYCFRRFLTLVQSKNCQMFLLDCKLRRNASVDVQPVYLWNYVTSLLHTKIWAYQMFAFYWQNLWLYWVIVTFLKKNCF